MFPSPCVRSFLIFWISVGLRRFPFESGSGEVSSLPWLLIWWTHLRARLFIRENALPRHCAHCRSPPFISDYGSRYCRQAARPQFGKSVASFESLALKTPTIASSTWVRVH